MTRFSLRWPALAAAVLCAGCTQLRSTRQGGGAGRIEVPPTLAVMEFENRAGFTGQWNLGTGMADLLTARLLESGRVTLLERKYIDELIRELHRQENRLFRKEGAVPQGRLRPARYLVRGTVTDFTTTGDVSGWFATRDGEARARASRARVAVALTLSDVESGEILGSVQGAGHATARGAGGAVRYGSMAFGGDAYFRTPLGRATDIAIGRAVRSLLRDLPVAYWEPRVAEVEDDRVIVNGGQNVGLKAGTRFVVRGGPRQITDPVTGEIIETVPGRVQGRIELREIKERSAHARLLTGEAARGDVLEPE